MKRLILVLLLAAGPGLAAETGGDLGRRVAEAQYLLASRPDLAAEQLESLLRENPGQSQLRFLLAQAWSRLERYDEALALLRELRAESPESRGVASELARLHLRRGDEAAARAALDPLLADPPDSRLILEVAGIYQHADRFDLAEATVLEGLDRIPPQDDGGRMRLLRWLFSEYELSGRGDAILRVLAEPRAWQRPDMDRDLLRAADRAFRDMEGVGAFASLADSLAAGPMGARLAPLLRWVYLDAGRDEDYLGQCLRSYEDQAVMRMNFLRREARRRAARPELARPLWAALAERGDSSRRSEARLALVDLDLAEDARHRLRGERPDSGLAGRLEELRQGNLGQESNLLLVLREQEYLRERLGRPERAEAVLRAILRDPKRRIRSEDTWRLELELGKDLLARGEDDAARRLFENLQGSFRERPRPENPDRRWRERESARLIGRLECGFQLARLEAVTGDAAAAQDSLAALARENPASGYANDALSVALLLAQSAQWPESLAELMIRSLELEMRARPAKAADLLAVFTDQFPEDEAAPVLLFRQGELREKALQGEAALSCWERLAEAFPEHHRADVSLDRAARLALRMGETARARALLERLLEDYPQSPLLPGIRALREELEVDA